MPHQLLPQHCWAPHLVSPRSCRDSFKGFPRLSSGDNPSSGAVFEGTMGSHTLVVGLVPAPAFAAILGVESVINVSEPRFSQEETPSAGQEHPALLWEKL